ncbi:amidohydrolase family protein [Ensifer sp. ENS04]|uniref:amidohydrolase family protein n=1 Tax=Ensifer sp. ENS04 TaxID=2769281 RepID=UPI0017870B93|nr:amidohydrolase family protein [Ensifer sp. ENS04]MBD9541466.1 amidohydrolase family protein [Ensifer sp. ENS04]
MLAEFLLANVRPNGSAPKDVLIRNGLIAEISGHQPDRDDAETVVVDGGGLLMLPGFVDAHTHLDKNLLGMPWYRSNAGSDIVELIENGRKLRRALGINAERQSGEQIELSVVNGTTNIRTHVDIDTECGLSSLEGVMAARSRYRRIVDIEIVAFPQSGLLIRQGTLELMNQAMREGADVVGGLDPSEIDRDPKGHLDTIFGMAERYGKPVDIHLHEPGSLGAFAVELIIERTNALSMAGQVTISHAFCLGMLDQRSVARLGEGLAKAGVHLMTKGGASGAAPPVMELTDMGVNLCSGSGGVRDTFSPFGNADMLDRAAIVAQRNDFRREEDIGLALSLCTYGGARMMGIPSYGIDVGCSATFVLVPGETAAEAVASGPRRRGVYRRGVLVAKDGAILSA